MHSDLEGRRPRQLLAAALALALLPLAACGDGGGSGSTQGNGQPVMGGSATYINHTESLSLDPIDARIEPNQGGNVLPPLYDHLIWIKEDGSIVPRLATSVTTSDGKQWQIKLREGVTFSDGTQFDAAAVKFNWERLRDPATAAPNAGAAAAIDTTEVVDPLTLRVTLKKPNRQWHRYLTASGLTFIGSPTAIAAAGKQFGSKPVGAGPFVLAERVQGDHMTFKRNPKYWDAPRPYLDELVIRPVPVAQQRFDSFEAGEGDFVSTGNPVPQTADLRSKGYSVVEPQLIGGIGLVLNNARAPFDDVRVRQALLLATDVKDFVDKGTGGSGDAITTLFPKGAPLGADISRPAVDRAKAQSLIDAYVAEKGGPVKIEFSVAEAIKSWAEVFQQQWAALKNVEVKITVSLGPEASRRLLAGQYDVTTNAVIGDDPEPDFYDLFYSSSSLNRSKFKDPAVDAALEEGRSADSIERRKAAYGIVERAVWDQVPYIFLVRAGAAYTAGKNIKNFQVVGEGYIRFADLWKEK
ncbi:ABC transporter substrate-binding protein [Dactylosporangium sp. AC04546]|uniref:ABC transporter substrate-binding protein n=1 Tax=Dactylosporangium sp. AC04546 TaxID=2862460 RepID=UPI001EE0C0C2|nr:ABC transporter substrate-binding protein [Dactylosporangium sp. AC04546]WVK86943.1 ABC transporter substrate-binding protein [Dactylosporangium sp. AC04546]